MELNGGEEDVDGVVDGVVVEEEEEDEEEEVVEQQQKHRALQCQAQVIPTRMETNSWMTIK